MYLSIYLFFYLSTYLSICLPFLWSKPFPNGEIIFLTRDMPGFLSSINEVRGVSVSVYCMLFSCLLLVRLFLAKTTSYAREARHTIPKIWKQHSMNSHGHPWDQLCLHVCIHVCMYVRLSVCLYVCMSVCLYMYVSVCTCMYVRFEMSSVCSLVLLAVSVHKTWSHSSYKCHAASAVHRL